MLLYFLEGAWVMADPLGDLICPGMGTIALCSVLGGHSPALLVRSVLLQKVAAIKCSYHAQTERGNYSHRLWLNCGTSCCTVLWSLTVREVNEDVQLGKKNFRYLVSEKFRSDRVLCRNTETYNVENRM